MKRLLNWGAATFLTFVLGVSFGSVSAQSTTGASVRCDGTLTLLLVTAMNEYDYQPPFALTQFDFSEYAPLVAEAADIPVEDLAPKSSPTPQIGDQAATAVSQAGESVSQGGLQDLGNAISDLSGTASDLANAGQEAVQSGAAAVNAGVQAVNGQQAANGPLLQSGALPGENDLCTALRTDLLTFINQQLRQDLNP